MKLLKQFIIILLVLFLGNLISDVFKIPIPGNVLGMVILTVALCTGIIKLKDVEEVSNFLLDHLAIFFIPSAVGIMLYLSLIRANLMAILIPTFFSIIIGLLVTGKIVEWITERKEENK